MPHAPPRRRAAFPLLFALLAALLSSAPTAQAWVCRPDPMQMCERVQDTTGLIFDIDVNTSPDDASVTLLIGLDHWSHRIEVKVCSDDPLVWVSTTGYCSTPSETEQIRARILLP